MGVIVLVIGVGLFWYCLPRNGKMHRFVGTELLRRGRVLRRRRPQPHFNILWRN